MSKKENLLQAYNAKQTIRDLSDKSAELKKKSQEINAQLNATIKKSGQFLHPENTEREP